jgi:hypothetical protein
MISNKFVIINKPNINDNLCEKELEDNEILQQKDDIENHDHDV